MLCSAEFILAEPFFLIQCISWFLFCKNKKVDRIKTINPDYNHVTKRRKMTLVILYVVNEQYEKNGSYKNHRSNQRNKSYSIFYEILFLIKIFISLNRLYMH